MNLKELLGEVERLNKIVSKTTATLCAIDDGGLEVDIDGAVLDVEDIEALIEIMHARLGTRIAEAEAALGALDAQVRYVRQSER